MRTLGGDLCHEGRDKAFHDDCGPGWFREWFRGPGPLFLGPAVLGRVPGGAALPDRVRIDDPLPGDLLAHERPGVDALPNGALRDTEVGGRIFGADRP